MNCTAKNVFLLDGMGALTTAILLSQVLARFESLFGMPKEVLFILSGLAFCFALYSITCHLLIKNNFEAYLKVIITASLIYCLATFGLVLLQGEILAKLGHQVVFSFPFAIVPCSSKME
ncbi:MAG: hypothetical protein WD398_12110 [Cyclobacteriaceae bacterium]